MFKILLLASSMVAPLEKSVFKQPIASRNTAIDQSADHYPYLTRNSEPSNDAYYFCPISQKGPLNPPPSRKSLKNTLPSIIYFQVVLSGIFVFHIHCILCLKEYLYLRSIYIYAFRNFQEWRTV
jgi:hypothetical protein